MSDGASRSLPHWFRNLEWMGLGVLFLFTFSAILGYGVFGRHPHLIPPTDSAARFYAISFKLFARAHIVVSAAILLIPLLRRTGLRWAPAFGAVFLVSFLSEFLGTGYGFPFGGYEYTSLLGWKLGGRVPLVIPVSWFLMALPSWAVARALFPEKGRGWARAILGAYLLTAWDLALDPAMSFLTPYWVWESPGPFYGMPWVNLAGWMGTGVVIMGLFEMLRGHRWVPDLDLGWLVAYYLLVLLMPLGMVLAAGLWAAVLATTGALLLPWALHRLGRTLWSPAGDLALTQDRVAS